MKICIASLLVCIPTTTAAQAQPSRYTSDLLDTPFLAADALSITFDAADRLTVRLFKIRPPRTAAQGGVADTRRYACRMVGRRVDGLPAGLVPAGATLELWRDEKGAEVKARGADGVVGRVVKMVYVDESEAGEIREDKR
jgi:hypothetical protein